MICLDSLYENEWQGRGWVGEMGVIGRGARGEERGEREGIWGRGEEHGKRETEGGGGI